MYDSNLIDIQGNEIACSIYDCEYWAVYEYDESSYCQRHWEEIEEEQYAEAMIQRHLEDRPNDAIINAYEP